MSKRFMGSPDGQAMDAAQIEANFTDIHPPLSEVQAMAESSRCLYCYDAPCVTACPTSIDIPKFIHQIRTKNTKGSAKTILSSNIMGGTCARVCPTEVLCEGVCVKNATGEEPVKIGQLQRYAVDHLLDSNADHPFFRAASTGKKVAVVGAGPAGLSFAHRAAMHGHDVVVFEAKAKAGGLNEYGLAAYKMVNDFAQAEVDFLLQIGGISIEYNKALGRDYTIESLSSDYDAVFVGVGLGDVNALGVDGEDKQGIENAISFIEDLRQAPSKKDVA
ncbi:MAG: FAD-dependent oxidoreductase, partial [Alphaproteobacteria bacterium]|nr:FAD-dependent oxidoreductase [Alphaproteobacteria bacterium]